MRARSFQSASADPHADHWIHRGRRIYAFLNHPLGITLTLPWFALGTVTALVFALFLAAAL